MPEPLSHDARELIRALNSEPLDLHQLAATTAIPPPAAQNQLAELARRELVVQPQSDDQHGRWKLTPQGLNCITAAD